MNQIFLCNWHTLTSLKLFHLKKRFRPSFTLGTIKTIKKPVRGKSVINLFYENSTRTRSSFEFAGKYLGADVVNINTSSSSVMKGESLKDTALTLDRLILP